MRCSNEVKTNDKGIKFVDVNGEDVDLSGKYVTTEEFTEECSTGSVTRTAGSVVVFWFHKEYAESSSVSFEVLPHDSDNFLAKSCTYCAVVKAKLDDPAIIDRGSVTLPIRRIDEQLPKRQKSSAESITSVDQRKILRNEVQQ